jgi:restriction system protein
MNDHQETEPTEQHCPGPDCLSHWLRWMTAGQKPAENTPAMLSQTMLFASSSYDDAAPAIRNIPEFQQAVETLAYSIFRLNNNRLTRAERPRLENLVENAIFKCDRFLSKLSVAIEPAFLTEYQHLRQEFAEQRRLALIQRRVSQGIKVRLEQIESLSPDEFEEFVGEVFEALGYAVEHVGGPGDNGADLKLSRGPASFVVQCKYFRKGLVGSPDLQKFLGTIHQTGSQKGFFVTTSTFSLSAEKFAASQPIELIDGPRLADMVRELVALDKSTGEPSASLF